MGVRMDWVIPVEFSSQKLNFKKKILTYLFILSRRAEHSCSFHTWEVEAGGTGTWSSSTGLHERRGGAEHRALACTAQLSSAWAQSSKWCRVLLTDECEARQLETQRLSRKSCF